MKCPVDGSKLLKINVHIWMCEVCDREYIWEELRKRREDKNG